MVNKRLQELLEFVESTDLQEVVWEKKGALINFRRSAISEVHKESMAGSVSSGAPHEVPKPSEPMTIKSTMVGTFFRSDSPTRPPMVVEGTVVDAGQPVAAIEAMKIMKDVVATASCKIVKALVANGHPVEYGQPLFEVEPEPLTPSPLPVERV
jgi:acetyl-CoA carboxylase biotin carboxyl carrier protein